MLEPGAMACKDVDSLRREFFRDPSQFWDNRMSKRRAWSPDPRHKQTQRPLWIHGAQNLPWAPDELRRLGLLSGDGVVHTRKQKLQDRPALMELIKTCGIQKDLRMGSLIQTSVLEKGLLRKDISLGNALITMYTRCGALSKAQEMLDVLPVRNVVTWNAIITGYAQRGFGREALSCFERMQLEGVSPDIMLWNTAILCYAEEGEIEEALVLYTRMQEQCLLPNDYSSVSALQGCCKTAAIEVGRKIHIQIQATNNREGAAEFSSTALIDMYGKCGSMVEALQVFDEMPTRSLVQWNAIITGYARQVESELVFSTFNKMREDGVQPDVLTFSSILFACSHAGLMREGQMYYESMVKEYNVAPHVRHDSCMVDLLGRVGCLSEAVLLLEKVPSQGDSVAWNTVLGASRKSGDVELSEQAFHTLLNLGQLDPTSFILMANVYADIGV